MSRYSSIKRLKSFSLLLGAIFITDIARAADSDPSEKGKIVADSGFRPNPNGFSFENWGGDKYPSSDLTANDAVALFGDKVCARWKDDDCVPTPATKMWLNQMNQMMKGGHCEGMAAMSAAFYVKLESVTDYGAKQTYQLKPKDAVLMSTISSYFVTQALQPVQKVTSDARNWPLQKIVDFIVESLKAGDDYVTLGIYGADGGHAITPYKVEELSEGNYRVYVYDNNYPGSEKYVDIDTQNDLWTYAGAALNPDEDSAPWEGGSGTMDITPLSSRFEPLQCPFCGEHEEPKTPKSPNGPKAPKNPSIPSDGISIFSPTRCSQLQATGKKDKKQLSVGKKGAKNEILGASMLPLRGSRGCEVRLPDNQEYEVVVVDDGKPNTSKWTDFVVFAPGNVYSMSDIAVSGNGSQSFSFGQGKFSYKAGGSQKPTLRVAGDRAGSNGYYEVKGFTLGAGFNFSADGEKNGRLTFSDNDPALEKFDVHVETVSESESETYSFNDVDAGKNGQIMLEIESDGDLDLDIDSDSDGTPNDLDADDDNDGAIDASDTDDDNDGVLDSNEATDFDHDSIPDNLDSDDDNDGVVDTLDADDATLEVGDEDSDHDGVVNEGDTDDDNDGKLDTVDSDDNGDGVAEGSAASGSSHEEIPGTGGALAPDSEEDNVPEENDASAIDAHDSQEQSEAPIEDTNDTNSEDATDHDDASED